MHTASPCARVIAAPCQTLQLHKFTYHANWINLRLNHPSQNISADTPPVIIWF